MTIGASRRWPDGVFPDGVGAGVAVGEGDGEGGGVEGGSAGSGVAEGRGLSRPGRPGSRMLSLSSPGGGVGRGVGCSGGAGRGVGAGVGVGVVRGVGRGVGVETVRGRGRGVAEAVGRGTGRMSSRTRRKSLFFSSSVISVRPQGKEAQKAPNASSQKKNDLRISPRTVTDEARQSSR